MCKRFLFKCDSNDKSGFGHFSRCLNLARWILLKDQNASAAFCGDYDRFAASLLKKHRIGYFPVFNNGSDPARRLVGQYDYLVIDSYSITQEYIDSITDQNIKTIFIDDFNKLDLRRADLIINFTVKGGGLRYQAPHLALGTNFFVAKPELVEVRKKNSISFREEIKNVFIFFSGKVGHSRMGRRVIEILDRCLADTTINYIAKDGGLKVRRRFGGGRSPYGRLTTRGNRCRLISPTYSVERYFAEADIVISGGGLTKYESAYCCIPSAVISVNPQQYLETKSFAAEMLAYDIGPSARLSSRKLERRLLSFIHDGRLRKQIYENAKRKFFTDSTERLVDLVLSI